MTFLTIESVMSTWRVLWFIAGDVGGLSKPKLYWEDSVDGEGAVLKDA